MDQSSPDGGFFDEVVSDAGVFEVIVTRRRAAGIPVGLRKPYEYIVSANELAAGYDALTAALAEQRRAASRGDGGWEAVLLRRKSLTVGIRLRVFLLAHGTDFSTGTGTGVTAAEWDNCCAGVQRALTGMLGPDALLYVEPYSECDKMQARFDTYIAVRELLLALGINV